MDEIAEPQQHPGWTLNFDLTVDDMIAYHRAVRHYKLAVRLVPRFLMAVSAFFAAVMMSKFEYASDYDTKIFGFTLFIAYVIYRLFWLLFDKIYYRNLYPEGSVYLAPRKLSITKDGISSEQENFLTTIRWPGVSEIICGERAVHLITVDGAGLIVPYRVLPPDVTPKEFIRVLRSFRECVRI